MPQRLDIICGAIKIFQVVDDTAATIIPPIPCGMASTLHSSTDMNAYKSKSELIYYNDSY